VRNESDGDARNLQRSLALRMEAHFPVAAVAVLNAQPELRDGTLILFFKREHRSSFKEAKKMELGMRHFCDCEVRVERDWHNLRED
jgi:hypothetical protein